MRLFSWYTRFFFHFGATIELFPHTSATGLRAYAPSNLRFAPLLRRIVTSLLEISLGLGEDGLILYAFIVCHGRLPNSRDVCYKKNIGAWAVSIREHQRKGTLTADQEAALRSMPKWPQAAAAPPPVYSQPSTEKSALISN